MLSNIIIERRREATKKWQAKERATPEGRKKNRDKVALWRESHREEARAASRKWNENNKEWVNKRNRLRYKNNPIFRMQCLLRSRMKDCWNNSSIISNSAYRDFLGCSMNDLKTHIESQFKKGMTWLNQGKWHIDHKIPLALFASLHANKQEEFFDLYLEDAFNYTNLRPEWGKENSRRGNRWILMDPNSEANKR